MGGADLRMGVSGAKFDAEDDFEVRLALAPPKLGQIDQKLNFRSKKIRRFFWGASKTRGAAPLDSQSTEDQICVVS